MKPVGCRVDAVFLLLLQVKELFQKSPFLYRDNDSVSIMNGIDEGSADVHNASGVQFRSLPRNRLGHDRVTGFHRESLKELPSVYTDRTDKTTYFSEIIMHFARVHGAGAS